MVELWLHNDGERAYIICKYGVRLLRIDFFKWLGWIITNWEDRTKHVDLNYNLVCADQNDIAKLEVKLSRMFAEKRGAFNRYETEISMSFYCNDQKTREGKIYDGIVDVGADSNFAFILVVEPLGDVIEVFTRDKNMITGGALVDKIGDIFGFFGKSSKREEELKPEIIDEEMMIAKRIDIFEEGKKIVGLGEVDIKNMFNIDFLKMLRQGGEKSIPLVSALATHEIYKFIKKYLGTPVYVLLLPYAQGIYAKVRDIISKKLLEQNIPISSKYTEPVNIKERKIETEKSVKTEAVYNIIPLPVVSKTVTSTVEYMVIQPVVRETEKRPQTTVDHYISGVQVEKTINTSIEVNIT